MDLQCGCATAETFIMEADLELSWPAFKKQGVEVLRHKTGSLDSLA